MKFARVVFLIAGLYGLVVLTPGYFFEQAIGRETPPPITHPEFFYGFLGVALAWQVLFLLIAHNPVRYRPMMIPSILEKLSYAGAVIVLLKHPLPLWHLQLFKTFHQSPIQNLTVLLSIHDPLNLCKHPHSIPTHATPYYKIVPSTMFDCRSGGSVREWFPLHLPSIVPAI